jgi:hypothetical protein
VEAISKVLRGDTQGFLGKTFKELKEQLGILCGMI